ncbi:hypothetical protein C8N43_1133 [Litoreibacter ponti]|uniref:Uncharacterized protein n=1 Tax=Litoreibacter ponti TaxID=1510457 RepID=A0A2T6BK87_9RHOB|nr:hypothetical protein [Litoreibacter ponti]PTX56474.1 hypothetical protein C8N43_1133 [Litoreibacter ponti]
MKKRIYSKDISFGDIDARHEILARDERKQQLFLDSFFLPPSLNIDKLRNGERFLVCGPKGSGKTACLRYLQNQLDKNKNSKSKFIVFRDDVTTQDREKIIGLSKIRLYETQPDDESDEHDPLAMDCLSAWQLFIHREIADIISRSHDFCAKTPDVLGYIKLLNSFFSQYRTGVFKKILQSITKGRIKISGFGQGFEAEAEFIDRHGNIDVSEFVRYCNGIVTNLDFNAELSDPRINIFFDELNISFVSGLDFRQNAVLIRDLVSACGTLNSKFSEHSLPIFIYTAIRSEVADSVESSVRELKKWIDDQAEFVDWYTPRTDYNEQPILGLLNRRIAANEHRQLGLSEIPNEIEWNLYFDPKVGNIPFQNFLLFETWGRPRDLVRLFKSVTPHLEDHERFGGRSFAFGAKSYSKSCWDEKHDELNAKYPQSAIETIKRFLHNFDGTFSRSQFETRVIQISGSDPRAKQFFNDRNLDVFLEDLYKVGILGNILKSKKGGSYPSYLYTGLTTFNAHDVMCVHRSLWKELGLTNSQKLQSKPKRK